MSEAESEKNGEQTGSKPNSDPGSFTQIFGALKKDQGVERKVSNDPNEFTQLFERSKKGHSTPFPDQDARSLSNDGMYPAASKREGGQGEFTQLLHRVSRESHTAATPPHPSALNAHQHSGGPSEFTQIVSQSMLREAGVRGGNDVLPTVHRQPDVPQGSEMQQPSPHPANPSNNADPLQSPQNTSSGGAPLISPQTMLSGVREASRMAGGGTLNSRVAEHAASATASRSSPMSTPPDSHRTSHSSKLQEHVPLLLIANLFLTLLLLLLGSFALLNR